MGTTLNLFTNHTSSCMQINFKIGLRKNAHVKFQHPKLTDSRLLPIDNPHSCIGLKHAHMWRAMYCGHYSAVQCVGALRDKTGTYASCFVFGGTTLFAACIVLLAVHLSQCRKQRKATLADDQHV